MRCRSGLERVGALFALSILALSGIYAEAHFLAQRAADEAAYAVVKTSTLEWARARARDWVNLCQRGGRYIRERVY